jgi:dTDP-glucose 4,6-dehydratase
MKSSEDRFVNIGNPAEYAARDIAQTVAELSGSESELVYEPLLKRDDPKRRCPRVSRAKEVLGWEPRLPARDGLGQTLDWFAQRLDSSQKAVTTGR